MCGIVGVTGKDNTVEILLNGLKKLEYRGYDSAGIYVNQNKGEHFLVKAKGRIADLEEKITPEVEGTTGIGHTRWATHGIPSVANAHPHVSNDRKFYLVHNGVINHFVELRDEFLSDVTFSSETDSEVIVQLIAKLVRDEELSTLDAFAKALHLLGSSSSYSLVLADLDQPDTLYVAKNKSPLLIGVGDGFNVVCSDAMAMINQTNEFIELEDGDFAVIRPNQIVIYNREGERIQRDHFYVSEEVTSSDKGTYDYYMLKEIDEQPIVIRKLIETYCDDNFDLINDELIQKLLAADRIYIIGAGTSYHAGLVAKDLLEKLAEIPTEVHVASEFGYNMPLLSKQPFFIFLTQSGETADSRIVLTKIKEMGFSSLTITNVPKSTLAREADDVLYLHAGPEIAVASTKAYTSQITVMAILAQKIGLVKEIAIAEMMDLPHELSLVANAMQELIDEKGQIEKISSYLLKDARNAFYIGRGLDYDVSLEAALKLKEVSYIQAEGFAAGELKHGTISLIEDGVPVIAIMTDKENAMHTRSNAQEVIARGGEVVSIISESISSLSSGERCVILPDVHPLLTPLVSIIPCQLFAYYASIQRGLDVDKPRNLAKSVTVE